MTKTDASELADVLATLTLEPVVCDGCGDGSGYLWSETEHRVIGYCECHAAQKSKRLIEWKRAETQRLKTILLPRINLAETVKRDFWPQLPETGGLWISGPAEIGKTHAVGWMVAKRINDAQKPFSWSWFSARQIFEAWTNQYADEFDKRSAAREVMNALSRHDLIIVNDFDKMGKVTEARQEHLFDMIDGIHQRGAALLAPCNVTINEFCERIGNENLFINRDGIGPIQRRLKDICKEVKL